MITQSELKEILDYNPNSGRFTWKETINNRSIKGSVAGYEKCASYMAIGFHGKSYLAHRLAWLYVNGKMPKEQIDHINHDRTDNRICNLRCVDRSTNQKNKSIGKNNKSGFMGVSWDLYMKKWKVGIKVNKKSIHLGYFEDKQLAIEKRKAANIKYGFHVNHGN